MGKLFTSKGAGLSVFVVLAALAAVMSFVSHRVSAQGTTADPAADDAMKMFSDGRQIFRFDTFGDEDFWGKQLKLHQAIEGSKLGGIGRGVSPKAALALGLKVDSAVLPQSLVDQLKANQVDLNDPANTLVLLKLKALVGVTGFFDASGNSLSAVGIQCAICHSTVDNSFAPGIGKRLDGWANRDLNVGAIVALAPDLTPYQKSSGQ